MEKTAIINGLNNISPENLSGTILDLFKILGYNTSRSLPLPNHTPEEFVEVVERGGASFNKERARLVEWYHADFLFQLTSDEVSQVASLFGSSGVDRSLMQSYLFVLIGLKGNGYTRTVLSEITREINRAFPMPVMVIFLYDDLLTLAVIDRRFNKKDQDKNVLSKITLIKDISLTHPHRAHIEILYDLSFTELHRKFQFTDFLGLHNAWHKTLDIKILSKKFFNELADWFFWAQGKVSFPNDRNIEPVNNIQMNLIRLITRLIFVWFLKEKKLVPEYLFDKKFIVDVLKSFDSDSKSDSKYYNAILQNLFFATLNQKMGERRFAADGEFEANKREYGIKTLYRYSHLFSRSKEEIIKLFSEIPFLNGGLFDCLDKPNDAGKILYVDGFTRKRDKVASVPEILFWGQEEKVDLSGFYDDEKRIRDCRGLLRIFSSYKFTIEENTPIEEEIALDPELLGKVFENLLAFYNPETAKTARKETGSYYTPREIVNYMTEESLLAYLKTKLLQGIEGIDLLGDLTDDSSVRFSDKKLNASRWIGKIKDLDQALRSLISYNEEHHPFDENEVQLLIYAIDHIKVIDPACGSGAFPMGVLHKLVYLLGKLDPDNRRWRKLQKLKAIKDADTVFDITEQEIRDAKLREINETFENNASDYGRKLYLIENCIYGVDIQPIAIQISKLRFFISLLVDQKEQKESENRGIRALPNLETKFVAANTLIGLEETDTPKFVTQEISTLENSLRTLRNKHFTAKSYREKMTLQNRDKELRSQISQLLQTQGFPPDKAIKISNYDIYDQMISADWFDPEWMFGLTFGFDIVIGNPPWGADLSKSQKQLLKSLYHEIDSSTPNSFAYFIGWSFRNYKTFISLILPDSLLIKDYAKTRALIRPALKEVQWFENTSIPDHLKLFKYVDHDVCVINCGNTHSDSIKVVINSFDRPGFSSKTVLEHRDKSEIILKEFDYAINLLLQKKDAQIYHELKKLPEMAEYMQCHEGIHSGNIREKLFQRTDSKDGKPLFFGGKAGDDIQNYWSSRDGWFVNYSNELIDRNNGEYASLRDPRIFIYPKIYITRTGNPFKAFYDLNTFASNNFFSLQHRDYEKNTPAFLQFVLPFIVSSVSQYFIRRIAAPRLGSTFTETKIIHLLKLRIPFETSHRDLVVNLTQQIINLKKAKRDTDILERLMDMLVLEIYFPDSFDASNISVIGFLKKANFNGLWALAQNGTELSSQNTISNDFPDMILKFLSSVENLPIVKGILRNSM